jgi:hypothetical protein
MNDLNLIVARLSGLGRTALTVAALLNDARGTIDLPPDRARQVLADLDHLAGALDAVASVLGAAVDPQAPVG